MPKFAMDVEFSQKTQIPASVVESDSHIVVFVWRQLEFAFFGALTSVGALFYLKKEIFMEEKVLIKSKMDEKARGIFYVLMGVFFGIPVLNFLSLLKEKEYGSYYTHISSFIMTCVAYVLGVITLIVFLVHRKCEMTVTEKNVRGRALFGKEVVLPIYMISAYSTRSFMSTIAVATASGVTKFALIGNYVEIGNVLSKMINDRQDNTVKAETKVETSNTNMDDLVKLKNLLDQGIITEEEFQAKKKQLLDL